MILLFHTIVYCQCDGSDTGSHHRFLMIIEFHGLVVEWESLEFVIEEEIHCLLIELKSQTLQERHVVVNHFIILGKIEIVLYQFIHKGMSKHINYEIL